MTEYVAIHFDGNYRGGMVIVKVDEVVSWIRHQMRDFDNFYIVAVFDTKSYIPPPEEIEWSYME
jgi:hypothetical protein